jgi:hypothetical protein
MKWRAANNKSSNCLSVYICVFWEGAMTCWGESNLYTGAVYFSLRLVHSTFREDPLNKLTDSNILDSRLRIEYNLLISKLF